MGIVHAKITIIRFAIRSPNRCVASGLSRKLPASTADVDEHRPVDPVAVSVLLAEEGRSIILGLHPDEPVVAPQAPASGVPLDSAADVAGEERFGAVDVEIGVLEHAETADAGSDVRHNGALIGRRDHDVAAVVEEMRRPVIESQAVELEAL